MKKILFFLMASAWLIVSCEGPAGRDGRNGLDGADAYWFVKNYTISSNQWELKNGVNELNSFFQAEIVIPELTREIYEKGNVFCYMYQNVDGFEVQTLLPYTVPLGERNGNTEYLWTETYACDFMPGSIMIYVNYSDFVTDVRPPANRFRVVLNY